MEKKALNQKLQEKGKKVRGVYDFLNQMIPSQGVSIDPLDLETLDKNIVALEKSATDLKIVRKELAEVFFEHFTGQKPTTAEDTAEEINYDAATEEESTVYEEEPRRKDEYQQQTTSSYDDDQDQRDRDHMIMEALRTGFDLVKEIGGFIRKVRDIKRSK